MNAIAATAARYAAGATTASNAAAVAASAAGHDSWSARARALALRATGLAAGLGAAGTGVGAVVGVAGAAASVAPTGATVLHDSAGKRSGIECAWHDVGVAVQLGWREGLRGALRVRNLSVGAEEVARATADHQRTTAAVTSAAGALRTNRRPASHQPASGMSMS